MKQQEYDYLSGHYRIDKASQTLWIQDRVGWRSFWREATKEEIGCFLVDFLPTVSSLIEQEERLNGLKIEPFCLLNISILERYKVSEAGLKEFYLAIGNGQFTFYFRCHKATSMFEVSLLSESDYQQKRNQKTQSFG